MQLALNTPQPFIKRLSIFDWLFVLALAVGAGYALNRYCSYMDAYDKGVLIGTVPALAWLGWFWKPVRPFIGVTFGLALLALYFYQGDLARMEQAFFLKYLISSQAAIMWMCALYMFATVAYWISVLARSPFAGKTATALTWSAASMGLTGLLVRWYEFATTPSPNRMRMKVPNTSPINCPSMVISFLSFCFGSYLSAQVQVLGSMYRELASSFPYIPLQKFTACFKQKPPKDENLLAVTG